MGMKIQTVARLFNIAASRLSGKYGQEAVFYLGQAMSLHALGDIPNYGKNYFHFYKTVGYAKDCFRRARWAKSIQPRAD